MPREVYKSVIARCPCLFRGVYYRPVVHIVASELKDPICHSYECQIGSFSSEATYNWICKTRKLSFTNRSPIRLCRNLTKIWYVETNNSSENTRHPPNVRLMLVHRLRRWPNMGPTLVSCLLGVKTTVICHMLMFITFTTVWQCDACSPGIVIMMTDVLLGRPTCASMTSHSLPSRRPLWRLSITIEYFRDVILTYLMRCPPSTSHTT